MWDLYALMFVANLKSNGFSSGNITAKRVTAGKITTGSTPRNSYMGCHYAIKHKNKQGLKRYCTWTGWIIIIINDRGCVMSLSPRISSAVKSWSANLFLRWILKQTNIRTQTGSWLTNRHTYTNWHRHSYTKIRHRYTGLHSDTQTAYSHTHLHTPPCTNPQCPDCLRIQKQFQAKDLGGLREVVVTWAQSAAYWSQRTSDVLQQDV